MRIQEYINNRNKYLIDKTYQRESDAWSNEDKQCLIDTILRSEPMPLFFMNEKTDEGKFYIVDGQQRLFCISQFYENKIKLNGKFSGKEKDGQTFNGKNPLSDEDKETFLNYDLKFHILENYDDDKVRMIFSRLQRGKPLSLGERLNAMKGDIVIAMREIAKSPFMSKSIGISKNAYGNFPDSARILFYEKYGTKGSSSEELYKFFNDFSDTNKKSKEYKNATSVLNILERCFPKNPGNYKYLEKHAWVLAVYTMVRELKNSYSLNGKENAIRKFIEDFHNKVYDEDFRKSNTNYQRFYDNVRGGWSEKIIKLRRDILIKEFLAKNDLPGLDSKRQISDEDKIAIFGRYEKKCQMCGIELKDFRSAEYHHKTMYSIGGKTNLENILVLCKKCHDIIHGKGNIDLPSEEEKVEIE